MPTVGEVIVHILYTIINSIIETTTTLARDVMLLFNIVLANGGTLGPLQIAVLAVVLVAVTYGLLKMFKDDVKHLAMAVAILVVVILLMLASARP